MLKLVAVMFGRGAHWILESVDGHRAGFTENRPWGSFPKDMRSPGSWSTCFPVSFGDMGRGDIFDLSPRRSCPKECVHRYWNVPPQEIFSPPMRDVETIAHRRTEESPVAEHFNSDGHTLSDMTVVVIDQIYRHDPCLRKIRESRWIRTLGTSYPSGMNLRVDSLWNLLDDHLPTRGFNVPPYQTSWLRVSTSR